MSRSTTRAVSGPATHTCSPWTLPLVTAWQRELGSRRPGSRFISACDEMAPISIRRTSSVVLLEVRLVWFAGQTGSAAALLPKWPMSVLTPYQ